MNVRIGMVVVLAVSRSAAPRCTRLRVAAKRHVYMCIHTAWNVVKRVRNEKTPLGISPKRGHKTWRYLLSRVLSLSSAGSA